MNDEHIIDGPGSELELDVEPIRPEAHDRDMAVERAVEPALEMLVRVLSEKAPPELADELCDEIEPILRFTARAALKS
jgi:hypothetical protein